MATLYPKTILITLLSLFCAFSFAQKTENNLSISIDLQTKYVWRGMEMQTEEAAPVLFPQLGFTKDNFNAYVMGGYAINGKYAEVDLGISYTLKDLTLGLNDYYYPTTDSPSDHYFGFSNKTTGHWFEGFLTYAPTQIPICLTLSNLFAGADKNQKGEQAYSSYLEIAGHHGFTTNGTVFLTLGAALNKSCYNGYSHNLSICNIELKYTYTVLKNSNHELPISVSYILNPIYEKAFVNCSLHYNF